MRHRVTGRTLGRSPSHQLALKRNLARALFLHGRIVTTLPKAKEVRPFVEKLITLAKKGTLHHRRLALQRLPDKDVVKLLFDEIGPRFRDRPGGYTRILKRQQRRLGDGGFTAFLELLQEGEQKVNKKRDRDEEAPALAAAPAVAPAVAQESPEQETPTPEEVNEVKAEAPGGEAPAEGETPKADGEKKPE